MTDKEQLGFLYEMRSELLKTRRAISEELLMVGQQIKDMESQVKRTDEYMSASEYIGIRERIRKEVQAEYEQAKVVERAKLAVAKEKLTVHQAPASVPVPDTAVAIMEKVEQHEAWCDKNGIEKPLVKRPTREKAYATIRTILKELDEPTHGTMLLELVNEQLGYTYKRSAFMNILSDGSKLGHYERESHGIYKA
ncbi:hypothetical protein PBC5_013 [Bacillus phage PBC5]|nr:hypothetical protein PBC5_013 [Bacillus phage PBC5]